MKKYEMGDIVFVSNVENPKEKGAEYHFFVVIDEDQSIISADLFGFLISSNSKKNKNESKYTYNEPIKKTEKNGLKVDSHVKCDTLYQFKNYCVINKIGAVDIEDFIRFVESYEKYKETLEKETITNK